MTSIVKTINRQNEGVSLGHIIKQQTGPEYIRTILYYLSEATDGVSREDLQKALLRQGTQGEHVMATIAQEFIQQGIEEG